MKQTRILDKENLTKHKMLFLNDDFIYEWKK